MRWYRLGVASFALVGGCIALPKPPEEHSELFELWRRYEEPTAVLDSGDAMTLSTASGWLAQARLIEGFRFIADRLSENVDRVVGDTKLEDLVRAQGTIEIREPCPGYDPEAFQDAEENGFYEVTLGVRASRIQRTFAGRASECRFLTALPSGDEVRVTLSTEFRADLGVPVALGGELPRSILVAATDLTADLSSPTLTNTREQHANADFRLVESGVETLVELPAFGVDGEGTAVVVAYSSGALGVRVRDGEWQCGTSAQACLQ